MMKQNAAVVLHEQIRSAPVQGWWVWDRAGDRPAEMVTCFFRRAFDRAAVGERPVLRISADGRYRAFLNGRLISRGPARGTPEHYHFETVDLEPLLQDGANILAVEVRWYGQYAPASEAHLRPGVWVNVRDEAGQLRLATDPAWKVLRSGGHAPHPLTAQSLTYYIPPGCPDLSEGFTHAIDRMCYTVVDPCEDVDLGKVPQGWQEAGFCDDSWMAAVRVETAYGRYDPTTRTGNGVELIPRQIPAMEELPVRPARVVDAGLMILSKSPQESRQLQGQLRPASAGDRLWKWDGAGSISVDGTGTDYVVLDMGRIITGHPKLAIDAPAGTVVEFRYSEALSRGFQKAVRDDASAGTVEGYCDTFTCRQGHNIIESFVWRAFRFLRLAIHHPQGAAHVQRLDVTLTAYPFVQKATFESSDPLHKQLWDVSWWTARMCAHETYEDCPYYEQLQYVGDTRLQALVSYMVAGDFRLARQALRQWNQSRRADGMNSSRAPGSFPHVMTPFSLIWIQFLEDFYRYSGDVELVRELMDGVASALRWFEQFDQDGLLVKVPYWIFTDWSIPSDKRRTAGSEGEMNLRRVGALQSASRLAAAIGEKALARQYAAQARRAADACKRHLWSAQAGLFCDGADGELISEHVSLLAILYDLVGKREGAKVLRRLESRDDLCRTTIYYSYYKFRAYQKLGRYADAYKASLHHWTDMLALHATTWFEMPEPTRSDCHGWGAWIMCDLLTVVLGIEPQEAGFASVRITPQVMDLDWARGSLPTVRGEIRVAWRRRDGRVAYEIELPPEVRGTLVTPDGHVHVLNPGESRIEA